MSFYPVNHLRALHPKLLEENPIKSVVLNPSPVKLIAAGAWADEDDGSISFGTYPVIAIQTVVLAERGDPEALEVHYGLLVIDDEDGLVGTRDGWDTPLSSCNLVRGELLPADDAAAYALFQERARNDLAEALKHFRKEREERRHKLSAAQGAST